VTYPRTEPVMCHEVDACTEQGVVPPSSLRCSEINLVTPQVRLFEAKDRGDGGFGHISEI
jgi:hypothetical protein